MNIIAIGIETDSTCVGCESGRNYWLVVNSIFVTFYVSEFGLKFYYYGLSCLKSASQILDFALVIVAIVDTWILQFVIRTSSVRSLSMLRVLRVARLSRVLRFMAKQTELRLLIQSFRDLHKFLIPFIITMLVAVYMSSLILLCFYERDKDDAVYPGHSRWSGSEYWGSVPRAMFTFFQVATGDRWARDIVRPLLSVYPLYLLLFIPFVCMMIFSLRSAVVARTSDSVIQSGSVAEDRLRSEEKRVQGLLTRLKSNFIIMKGCANEPEWLTYEDLTKFIRMEENRRILSMLAIPVSDLVELFYILDFDGTGQIRMPMFFQSVLRISGPAMGRHVTSVEKKAQSLANYAAMATFRISKLDEKMRCVDRKLSKVATLYNFKNGRVVESDTNYLITSVDSNVSGEHSSLKGRSGSSLSLRSRRSRLLRNQRSFNTSFLTDN